MTRRSALLGIVLSLSLLATACAGDDDSADQRDDDAQTPETTAAGPEASGEDMERVAHREYVTRPDLTPPAIDVTTSASPTPGLVFLAPKRAGAQTGPLIVDGQGETIWAAPTSGDDVASDLRVQTYEGEPVLTWWEGRQLQGLGFGEYVIADSSYQEIARVRAGNGLEADFHELRLTDEGTALLVAYRRERADLTAVGGPVRGYEMENYVQEIDVDTGQVLMEWRAGDHVPVGDTYSELTDEEDGSDDGPFDWFHVNSVAPGPGDTLLVSARNTHTIYAIDRATGEMRWRLGGKASDIAMGEGTEFTWQHDAQWLGGSRISMFDNHATITGGDASRALILDVDPAARTSTLVAEVRHPEALSAGTQGNTQMLDGGGLFVGWGSEGRVTEFAPDGQMVFDATFAPADSYRGHKFEWTGQPTTPPDVVVRSTDDDRVEVFVSWNGATEVAQWRVVGGDDPDALMPLAIVARDGFETAATVDAAQQVAVEALDASGDVLARSDPVAVTN